jgi:hypothetical protein
MFDIDPPIPILAEPDVGLSLGSMIELYDLPEDAPQWVKDIKVDPKLPHWWDHSRDLV